MKPVEASVKYYQPKPNRAHGDGFAVTLPNEVGPFDFIQAGREFSRFKENHPLVSLLGCVDCNRWGTDPAAAEEVIAPQYGHIKQAENEVEITCEGSHLYPDDDFSAPCVTRYSSLQKVKVEVRS